MTEEDTLQTIRMNTHGAITKPPLTNPHSHLSLPTATGGDKKGQAKRREKLPVSGVFPAFFPLEYLKAFLLCPETTHHELRTNLSGRASETVCHELTITKSRRCVQNLFSP